MNLMLLLPLLPGCKKVVEAPEDLETLIVHGFVHFDDEDAYTLEDTQRNLLPEIKAHQDEMAEGFKVNSLTSANLEAVGVADPDVTEIVGALGVIDYTHSLDEVLDAVSSENKQEMFDNFLEFEVKDTTDRKCFLSGECETLEQTVYEKTNVTLIGDAARTYVNAFRWINGEDLPRAVMIRQLNPDPVEFEGSAIDMTVFQQYSFVILYEEGDHARRVESFWVDFEVLSLSVPDNYAVKNAVQQMGKQAEKVDTWIDENR